MMVACSGCKQPVQVPVVPRSAGASRKTSPTARPSVRLKSPNEGSRTFWALCRLFIWGICLAGVGISILYYLTELGNVTKNDEKQLLALQSLVFLFGVYYLARSFDDSTKSLEELFARLRRRKR
jgi:hypothetical protein